MTPSHCHTYLRSLRCLTRSLTLPLSNQSQHQPMVSWSWISAFVLFWLLLLYLVYGNARVIALFHARRVRVYFGKTHPRRHHHNRVILPSSLRSSSSPSVASVAVASQTPPILPRVYEVYSVDHRDHQHEPHVRDNGALRIVSWNIELGYHINDIIKRLHTLMPIDVLLLQEVDIIYDNGNDDVNANGNGHGVLHVDCVDAIAKALHMTAVFTGIIRRA